MQAKYKTMPTKIIKANKLKTEVWEQSRLEELRKSPLGYPIASLGRNALQKELGGRGREMSIFKLSISRFPFFTFNFRITDANFPICLFFKVRNFHFISLEFWISITFPDSNNKFKVPIFTFWNFKNWKCQEKMKIGTQAFQHFQKFRFSDMQNNML